MPEALVTGGAGGIGAGIARALAIAGYRVTVTGLSGDDLAAVVPGENIRATLLDVTSDASVATCLGQFDRLDVLVNCAGIILRDGAEFAIPAFQQVIDVNLTGTMRMCVAAHPLLAESGGSIVNIASMLSFHGGPLVPAYTASKGGVAQLTKALAGAWAPRVRVNAVAPGWIETELTRDLVNDRERSAAILARTPAGRWGVPDDIGGAVAFLCSDAARFVTGIVMPIDGGYLAK